MWSFASDGCSFILLYPLVYRGGFIACSNIFMFRLM